jgi:integrase
MRAEVLIQEVIDSFLYNRKHGLLGSKGKASSHTLAAYEYALRPFADFMQDTRNKVGWAELSAIDIRFYVEDLTSKVGAPNWSRSRYLLTVKVLKTMFRWMEKDEDCIEEGLKSFHSKMPVAGKMPRREYIPTPRELKEWRRAFPTGTYIGLRDWIVFSILLETGMRRGEICNLKIEHLQLDNRQIYIPDGKTGSRTIAITDLLARNIKLFLKRRSRTKHNAAPYLLSSLRAVKPNPNMVTKLYRRVRNKYGLSHVTPHTMRHAFCTYYLKRGGNPERLRNITGHTSFDALLPYMHLAQVGGAEQKAELEKASPLRMLDERD